MSRITTAHLEAKLDTVNRMLGFQEVEGEKYPRDGRLEFHSAYGSISVRRTMRDGSSGSGQGSTLMTKRELANYLDGMMEALQIVRENATA